MAREIAVNQDYGFRAVHIRKDWFGGEDVTTYEGIYNKVGTARQRVSFWRNHLGENFVDGWIEEATVKWKRVE